MRPHSRRLAIGLVAAGMVLATTPAAHADPLPEEEQPTSTVTLVTGDQVVLRDGKPYQVKPGPGREGMTFAVHRDRDQLTVVPADAQAAVNAGRIDRRLFDVTTLEEFGYDRGTTVPLIVTGQGASRVATAGRALPSVGGYAYTATKGAAWQNLSRARGVSKIWLDGKRKATLDHSVPQIGAPAAWEAGFTGAGVTVAVLDTGVDQTHPDLADREIAEADFSGSPDNVDHAGHGTHVASTIAGTGAKSGGKYRGVASGARILDGKVLDDWGWGTDSGIVAGMEWAVQQGADIVNLSLGGTDTPGIDPLEAAVNSLSEQHGTLFVIASGNNGERVSSPGSADAALTVGAVDREDQLAPFSNPGPRLGDGAVKPDVTAPGVDIVAARHADGTIGPEVEPGYTSLSGTSMATPHAAGAAALLAQQHPDYTGAQLKALLTASAKPTAGLTPFQQGAGRIDVARALTQQVVAEPTSLGFGTVAWPHDDDAPIAKTLTYRNTGDTGVTLALTLDTDAPGGMFSLSANEVTVPAGGAADVTVTGDGSAGDVDGTFSGTVVATAGGTTVRTPFSLDREVESYNLTLDLVDLTGAPASDYSASLLNIDTYQTIRLFDPDGSVGARVPKGRYVLDVMFSDGDHWNFLVGSNVVLDEDVHLTADARTTKPIAITPPGGATLGLADIGYTLPGGAGSSILLWEGVERVSTGSIGDPLPGTTFVAGINTHWRSTDGTKYGLVWFPQGRMPTGWVAAPRLDELAKLRTKLGSTAPDRTGEWLQTPAPTEGEAFVWTPGWEVPLPSTQTSYVTTEGTAWQSSLRVGFESWYMTPFRTFLPGRTADISLNRAVFGPSLTGDLLPGSGRIFRLGNELHISPALFADSAGNTGSSTHTGSTALYRDGQLVGETPYTGGSFEVPSADGAYRLVMTAERPTGPFDVSTAVTAEWTFRSAYVDEDTPTPVTASALRFQPRLDDNNTAKAGAPFVVPLSLQRNGSGAEERPKSLTVEVSYDEGATWQKAETLLNVAAVLHHPADATSVSLRATATDRAGNTLKETIIRAYKLRP
ncbi:S8 family serine peptidase [Actinophytocola algeriensis]|uniref:Subtilisin family serine protease n=1 Tax=Actinophytocola algeriensis TaxID=1768010 RepID=A0A7W7VCA3_9PSEU|nr:S8 family serine peptidase [Actinophytocola algeriensis]MBB4904963.1 subtilisin family serine protease [Actinophytocola algeriensis]MBE1476177.1 subtilisin family serine protease [Actinophytocola algeriensis]